jgi:hypothetical protein
MKTNKRNLTAARKLRWTIRACDRCGDQTLTRKWHGVANLCRPCISVAEAEAQR